MLGKNIQKTIKLIKKSARHPKLMIVLINHLSFLIPNEQININLVRDDLEKFIFLAASKKMCAQFTKVHANDKKILEFLKNNRKTKSNYKILFRIKLILLYLINRSFDQLNNFIIFELIDNQSNSSDLQPFIAHLLLKLSLIDFYNIQSKKRLPVEYFEIFLTKSAHFYKNNENMESQEDETQLNIIKSTHLLIYTLSKANFNFTSFKNTHFDLSDSNTLFILECFSFCARNHQNSAKIRQILPDDPFFVNIMRKFIASQPILEQENTAINFENLLNSEDVFIANLEDELSARNFCKKFIQNIRKTIDDAEQKNIS